MDIKLNERKILPPYEWSLCEGNGPNQSMESNRVDKTRDLYFATFRNHGKKGLRSSTIGVECEGVPLQKHTCAKKVSLRAFEKEY